MGCFDAPLVFRAHSAMSAIGGLAGPAGGPYTLCEQEMPFQFLLLRGATICAPHRYSCADARPSVTEPPIASGGFNSLTDKFFDSNLAMRLGSVASRCVRSGRRPTYPTSIKSLGHRRIVERRCGARHTRHGAGQDRVPVSQPRPSHGIGTVEKTGRRFASR